MSAYKMIAAGVVSLCLLSPIAGWAKTHGHAKKPVAPKATATLDNLQKLYYGHMSAQKRHTAYAVRAKAEGYEKISVLFRALAKSEGIQAGHLAKIMKALGGKASARLGAPKLDTTEKNLRTAINEITYAISATYPDYVKQADLDKADDASKAFDRMRTLGGGVNRLLVAAASNLEAQKSGGEFFVCKDCGYVAAKLDFANCPVCGAAAGEFEAVH